MARRSEGLSDRHRRIMEFLTTFSEQNGYSPSIRQIGDHIAVKSTSLVDYYLNQLEEMGYITREGRVSRSIRVLKPMYAGVAGKVGSAVRKVAGNLSDLIQIPVLGRIVASAPIPMPTSDLAYFDSETSVEMARSLLPAREKPSELFALEVQGDSMIDAMINDGDIVILKPAQAANNGDMVAVWLDDRDETTLKYFYQENGRVRLQPANPSMQPIIIEDPSIVEVQGKVVLVIRQLEKA